MNARSQSETRIAEGAGRAIRFANGEASRHAGFRVQGLAFMV